MLSRLLFQQLSRLCRLPSMLSCPPLREVARGNRRGKSTHGPPYRYHRGEERRLCRSRPQPGGSSPLCQGTEARRSSRAAIQELVRDYLPPGVTLLDMGEHRLKDLARPEHVFQLVVSGLPSEFPPLKSLDNHPNNLPMQPTPFIGQGE